MLAASGGMTADGEIQGGEAVFGFELFGGWIGEDFFLIFGDGGGFLFVCAQFGLFVGDDLGDVGVNGGEIEDRGRN